MVTCNMETFIVGDEENMVSHPSAMMHDELILSGIERTRPNRRNFVISNVSSGS